MTIKRIWHGWTTPANASAYEHVLKTEVLPSIEAKNIPGISEDDLTNNNSSQAITVLEPRTERRVAAAIRVDPGLVEKETSVELFVTLTNTGDFPLTPTIDLFVHDDAGLYHTATPVAFATLEPGAASLEMSFGTFTPLVNGRYRVSLGNADPAITLVAPLKEIQVGPYAVGTLTVDPTVAPMGSPVASLVALLTSANSHRQRFIRQTAAVATAGTTGAVQIPTGGQGFGDVVAASQDIAEGDALVNGIALA